MNITINKNNFTIILAVIMMMILLFEVITVNSILMRGFGSECAKTFLRVDKLPKTINCATWDPYSCSNWMNIATCVHESYKMLQNGLKDDDKIIQVKSAILISHFKENGIETLTTNVFHCAVMCDQKILVDKKSEDMVKWNLKID